jgi:hypothetical protein
MRSFCTALVGLSFAISLGADPAFAGRPTEAPDDGYTVIYFLGRMYASGAQETIVTCTNVGTQDATVRYEVWDDPSVDPSSSNQYGVPAGGVNAWGTSGNPGLATARLSVSDRRAAVLCTAHVQDASGVRGFVPLFPVGKPPKISIK